ncbi:MAG: flavodoxin family protein [Desulfuromonadales bacterium]|nr:flavodoxin family protein [Desulfuromonadales bacterium]
MEMNILGVVGSPRKGGNCEIMVKEISRRIDVPHQLNLLRLPDFNLRQCIGCYRCLFKQKRCILKDDLQTVLKAICDADALILAAPTYIFGAHACLKLFVDRALCFYGQAEQLWGKPAVGVGIAGIEGREGNTLLDIERVLMALHADNRLSKIIYGALPGETMYHEGNRQAAAELAAALFAPGKVKRDPHCRFCSGETFRFLEQGRVRCMLCSATGRLLEQDGRMVFQLASDEHEIFTNEAAGIEHFEWLRGMVGRFNDEKERLKEIVQGYSDEGAWIRPDGGE